MNLELFGRSSFFRRNQTDDFGWMMKPDKSHSFCKIAVVGNHHGAIVMVKPGVVQQMDSEVDIRSLFLCFDDSLIGSPGYGPSQRGFHLMTEKMSIVNLDVGSVRPKSPKVGLLPEGLVGVLRRRRNQGSEILYADNLMGRFEDFREENPEIKPFMRRASHGPVVKVESINIDGCSHQFSKKQEPPEGGSAAQGRNLGGGYNFQFGYNPFPGLLQAESGKNTQIFLAPQQPSRQLELIVSSYWKGGKEQAQSGSRGDFLPPSPTPPRMRVRGRVGSLRWVAFPWLLFPRVCCEPISSGLPF